MTAGGERAEAAPQKPKPAGEALPARVAVPEAVRQQDATMRMACARSPRLGLHMRQCLDAEAARVPSAQREQERSAQVLQAVVAEPDANSLGIDVGNDGTIRGGSLDMPTALQKSLESHRGDGGKVYQELVDYGKSLKSDPNKLMAFVAALDTMLYKNYKSNPSAVGPLPEQAAILQQNITDSVRSNFTCAEISLFTVRYLDAIGVDAITFMGVAVTDEATARRYGGQTGHSITVLDLGNGNYGVVGLSQKVVLPARSLEEAFRLLSKRSDAFVTRGTMLMYGSKDGEYYRKYILDQETLYGHQTEFSSDENLRLNTAFVSDLEAMSVMEKRDLVAALQQSARHGFRVKSISVFGSTSLEGGPPDSHSKVRFEGMVKGGTYTTLDFNLKIAQSEERFGAVLKTVSDTTVQRIEGEIGTRHTRGTSLFDTAQSRGGRLSYESTRRVGAQDSIGFGGAVRYEQTSGQSATFEGQKSTTFDTLSFGADARYIRTYNLSRNQSLDLWVGTGLQGYALNASSTGVRAGQKPTTGASQDFDFRMTQTLGGNFRGTSDQLDYSGTLAFSVVEDTNLADPSTQAVGLTAGTMAQGEVMIVYRPVDGVGVYGKVEAVRLQMPVNTRLLAGYKMGVTLNDVAGARGLNISADWAQQLSTDYLHLSHMSTDLTDVRNQVIGTRISYFDEQSGSTLGVGGRHIRREDSMTGETSKETLVLFDYTASF